MRRALVVLAALVLAACRTAAPVTPDAPYTAAGMVGDAPADSHGPAGGQRPAYNTDVLPAISATAVINAATALLQRPTGSSAVLKTLAAGDTVQVLGPIDNAEGQWLSVSIGDTQGWVRATQVKP